MKIQEKRKAPPAKVVLTDLLLVCLLLCVFSFFHHVLPAMQAKAAAKAQAAVTVTAVPAAATEPPAPTAEAVAVTAVPEETPAVTASPEPTPEPTPDTRTEWQIKFADKFTDEVVRTENSYSSPNVSVTIDTVVTGSGSNQIVYYVADIYVGSVDCFQTAIAGNAFSYFSSDEVENMDAEHDAVLSVNGDYYSVQKTGFLVRNSAVYKQDQTYCDICVMFRDGSIECIPTYKYKVQDILDREPYQVWNFGPTLLDAEGKAITNVSSSTASVNYPNPRTALGYYEPGHYCLVVVDGRQDGWSKGMTLPELAKIFEDLGCTTAYNMDGGGSSVMLFGHEKYSRVSNTGDRKISDLIIICDIPANGTEG